MSLLSRVKLRDPKLSNFDLSFKTRTNVSPGFLYPIVTEECVAGDYVSYTPTAVFKTQPTLAPLFGAFKCRIHAYYVPYRLYNNNLRLNANVTNTASITYPQIEVFRNIPDNGDEPVIGTAPGSLMDYLGFPQGFKVLGDLSNSASVFYNATPYLGYYDIFRNYYMDRQQTTFAIASGGEANTSYSKVGGTDRAVWNYATLQLRGVTSLDDWIESMHGNSSDQSLNMILDTASYNGSDDFGDFSPGSSLLRHGGLCCVCHGSDLNTSWLGSTNYDRYMSQFVTVAQQADGVDGFTINQLRKMNKFQKMYERSVVAGGQYGDWIKAQYGVDADIKLDIPQFIGGATSYITFDEVVSTSNTTSSAGGDTGLGDLAGRGKGGMRSRAINYHVKEPGFFMVMMSIVPVVDYWQGLPKWAKKINLSHSFVPALDNLGFQPLDVDRLVAPGVVGAVAPAQGDEVHYFGVQPAWSEYMSNVNRTCNDFAGEGTQTDWALLREFSTYNTSLVGAAVDYPYNKYVIPDSFNRAFAVTVNSDNFNVNIGHDLFMKRPISKQLMPNML